MEVFVVVCRNSTHEPKRRKRRQKHQLTLNRSKKARASTQWNGEDRVKTPRNQTCPKSNARRFLTYK